MRTIVKFLLTAGIVAAASPTATLSCGVASKQLCANTTSAIQPCKTTHPNPNEEVIVCNQASYFGWPTAISWKQCQAKCSSSKDCQSFEYYYYEPEGEAAGEYGGASGCNLFNHTVTSYTVTCPKTLPDDGSITPLAGQYYDASCAQPTLLTSGTVLAKPNTNPVNGTCNSQRLFNNDQQQWAQIGISTTPINQTQVQCQTACKKQSGCKSYYFGNETEGYYNPPLSTDQQYWPTIGPNGFQPALCLLLSEPVKSYTTAASPFYDTPNSFYDLNCPTS